MATILELAILSSHCYAPLKNPLFGRTGTENYIIFDFKQITPDLNGWYIYAPASLLNAPDWLEKNIPNWIKDTSPGFKIWEFVKSVTDTKKFPICYLKLKAGIPTEAVFAIPGTHKLIDVIVDTESWYGDANNNPKAAKIPSVYTQVIHGFQHTLRVLHSHFSPIKITLTGHSLGGALSKLIAAYGHRPFYTVAFNGPGVGNLPGVDPKQAPYLLNVNSIYGFVNRIGKTLGKIIPIHVQQGEAAAINLHQEMQAKLQEANQAEKKAKTFKNQADIENQSNQYSAAIASNGPILFGGEDLRDAVYSQIQTNESAIQNNMQHYNIYEAKASSLRHESTLPGHIEDNFGSDHPWLYAITPQSIIAYGAIKTFDEGKGPIYQQHSITNVIQAITNNPQLAHTEALSIFMSNRLQAI